MNPLHKNLRILHLEDLPTDAELVNRELKRGGLDFEVLVVDNENDFRKALTEFSPDVILSDHSLPSFNSLNALEIVHDRKITIPFILITSTTSEETAVSVMKEGAWDYILKDRMQRLPRAIASAVEKWQSEKEKQNYYDELIRNEKKFRGLIEHSHDIVSLVNENFESLYRSPSSTRITGFEDHERVRGGGVDQTHPDDIEYLENAIKQAIANPGTPFWVSFRSRHKKGHFIWIEGVITSMLHDESIKGIISNFRDVTETKLAQEQMQEAHQRLLFHLKNSPLGFIEWNQDLQVTKWSNRAQEIFGWSEKEFKELGKTGYTQVYDEDFLLADGIAKELLSGKVSRNRVIHRNYRKDGSVIWCEWFNSALKNKEGKVITVMSLVNDITDRKKIEQELQRNQFFLEKASEAGKIGYWTSELDLRNGKLTWSKEVFKIFQLEESEFDGKNSTFLDFIHPDDLERVNGHIDVARNGNQIYNIDHRIILKNGNVRWVNERAQFVRNEKNEVVLMVGIVQDINDRKIIEQVLREYNDRYEILSKATNDVIWDWDVAHDKIIYSRSLSTVFGYDDEKVIRSELKWWADRVHPEDHDRILSEIETVFEKQLLNWEFSYRYLNATGEYKYIHDRVYVVYDKEGKPERMIGAMQDVTELTEYRLSLERKVEERTRELNSALQKEKELVEMKSRFVSIASHEFRTPLSAILIAAGFIKKFKKRMTQDDIDQKLIGIETQVNHMTALLNDILTVGKNEAGKIEVHWSTLNIRDLFKNLAIEVVNSTRRTHRVNMKLNCEKDNIQSDEGLLRNIVINLLTNAIKFSEKSDEIGLTVTCVTGKMKINVIDHGLGIPPDDISKLFQPFFRAGNVSSVGGTGLGLSIVKKAVDLLGGEVEVKSQLGVGTEFIVLLPLK